MKTHPTPAQEATPRANPNQFTEFNVGGRTLWVRANSIHAYGAHKNGVQSWIRISDHDEPFVVDDSIDEIHGRMNASLTPYGTYAAQKEEAELKRRSKEEE